jgi:hypothetical protein
MIPTVPRVLPLAVVSSVALAGCGSSATKTVTKFAPGPATTTATTPATTPATTAATSTASTPTTTAAPIYFEGAAGGRVQRPSSLQLTADGTLAVSGVQWTSWGGSAATGTGIAGYHGCTPNCAQAPVHTALVSIRLASIRTCSGSQYYSSVTLTMNSGRLLDEQFLQRSWSPC